MVQEFQCDMCAFRVRSETDDEIVEMVQNHARGQHDTAMSRDEVRNQLENV